MILIFTFIKSLQYDGNYQNSSSSKRVSFDDSIQEEVIEIPIDLDNCQNNKEKLRKGFLIKVLGIVFFQLIVTSIFPTVCVLVPSVGDVFKNSEYLTTYIVFDTVAIFISLIFLFFFKDKHPYNLLILTLFTLCISFLVGITCLAYQPATIAQGFLLTLGDVLLCGGAVFFWRKTKLFIFGYIIINLIFILNNFGLTLFLIIRCSK